MDAAHQQLVERIRSLAKKKRITLSHLADRAGVGRSHFWEVLRGGSSPTVEWLDKVAAALGVPISELFK